MFYREPSKKLSYKLVGTVQETENFFEALTAGLALARAACSQWTNFAAHSAKKAALNSGLCSDSNVLQRLSSLSSSLTAF